MSDIETRQSRIDQLVDELPEVLARSEEALIRWIGEFAEINDNCYLHIDFPALAALFHQAGYTVQEGGPEKVKLSTHGAKAYRRRLIEYTLYFLEGGKPIPKFAKPAVDYYFSQVNS